MSHVEDEEEDGEVDADVEVEACGRRTIGDAITISDQAKEEGTSASRVVPLGACSTTPHPYLFAALTTVKAM